MFVTTRFQRDFNAPKKYVTTNFSGTLHGVCDSIFGLVTKRGVCLRVFVIVREFVVVVVVVVPFV